MSREQLLLNRREEARRICQSRRISWRRQNRNRRNGYLFDVSSTGVSFVTESEKAPRLGQEIDLHLGAGIEAIACKVVRIVNQEDGMTLIGCRRDPEMPATLSPSPNRKLSIRKAVRRKRQPQVHAMAA